MYGLGGLIGGLIGHAYGSPLDLHPNPETRQPPFQRGFRLAAVAAAKTSPRNWRARRQVPRRKTGPSKTVAGRQILKNRFRDLKTD